jgi:hypothetical protein
MRENVIRLSPAIFRNARNQNDRGGTKFEEKTAPASGTIDFHARNRDLAGCGCRINLT